MLTFRAKKQRRESIELLELPKGQSKASFISIKAAVPEMNSAQEGMRALVLKVPTDSRAAVVIFIRDRMNQ